MTPQEQQLIESLFQRLTQGAAQSGPRDPQAEALIEQRVQSLPGAAYYMTQTLLVQERALQQAEARLASQPQQSSFLPPASAPGQQYPYAAAPSYAGPAYQEQRGGGAGSFLAGAGKIALGVVGGVLVADAAMGLAHDVFGQGGFDREDRGSGQQGFDRDDRGQGSFDRQDQRDQQTYGDEQAGGGQQDEFAEDDDAQQDDFVEQDSFDLSDSSGDFGSGQDW
ncbi:MAG TPA: DUF2076 family protein [Candidatus Dormibacteraeota bacterium]|nr:DUF2076 family protein [Candidatus Dormibacteraeota bacterium]